jgi:hypothetical protein
LASFALLLASAPVGIRAWLQPCRKNQRVMGFSP